jgi:hypothetical protein
MGCGFDKMAEIIRNMDVCGRALAAPGGRDECFVASGEPSKIGRGARDIDPVPHGPAASASRILPHQQAFIMPSKPEENDDA